jgi:23S rRNA (cytidine1920-2'-O)/16S rRNA (cytidine1409-2'-O)-methyltransferase
LKVRLDELLLLRNITSSLETARALIGAGKVYINDRISDKAGILFDHETHIRIKEECPYVSRGGLKLQAGLVHFGLDVTGMVCIDVGASTGGFTDCLLQNGAAKVYAVDVAYGQLDWKLRQDQRVVVIERFNARKLTSEHVAEFIDLAVLDASFISLTKLIPSLLPFFQENIELIALIKPQFELPRGKISRGGVVRDARLHEEALDAVRFFAGMHHLKVEGIVPSPILGPKGNKEFLIYLSGDCSGRE